MSRTVTSLDFDREHGELVSEEKSPVIDYIEDFYTQNPSKYSANKIDTIASLSKKIRDHLKNHIETKLGFKKKGVAEQKEEQPERGIIKVIEGLQIGPFGIEQARQAPVETTRMLIQTRRGFHPAVIIDQKGHFVTQPGASIHTLRRLATFLRGVEK